MNLDTFLGANLVSLLNLHWKRRHATLTKLENSVTWWNNVKLNNLLKLIFQINLGKSRCSSIASREVGYWDWSECKTRRWGNCLYICLHARTHGHMQTNGSVASRQFRQNWCEHKRCQWKDSIWLCGISGYCQTTSKAFKYWPNLTL